MTPRRAGRARARCRRGSARACSRGASAFSSAKPRRSAPGRARRPVVPVGPARRHDAATGRTASVVGHRRSHPATASSSPPVCQKTVVRSASLALFAEDARQGTQGLGRVDRVEHEPRGAQCDAPPPAHPPRTGSRGRHRARPRSRRRWPPAAGSRAGPSPRRPVGARAPGSRPAAGSPRRPGSAGRARGRAAPATRPAIVPPEPAATTTIAGPAQLVVQLARGEVETEGADRGRAAARDGKGRAAGPGQLVCDVARSPRRPTPGPGRGCPPGSAPHVTRLHSWGARGAPAALPASRRRRGHSPGRRRRRPRPPPHSSSMPARPR